MAVSSVVSSVSSRAEEWGAEWATLTLPDPHPLQRQILLSPARHKVCCLGRRTGKDRTALLAAICGHGARPQGRGVLSGGDVIWLARDYGQAAAIWREEILPRFSSIDGITIRESGIHAMSVDFFGLGSLRLKSAENVDSIRGIGKNVVGVVVNEAAHFDFQYAWRSILRPVLADHRGWSLTISTPNSGEDGGIDEFGAKISPSFFNKLCDEIEGGKRRGGPGGWALFEGDARDNPYIDAEEFAALCSEYPPGSTGLDEEVYARRLAAGGRLPCLPELDAEKHIVPAFTPPTHWPQFAAYDWGYAHNAVWIHGCADEDGTITILDTLWMHRQQVHEQIQNVREYNPPTIYDYIVAGLDAWHEDRSRRTADDDTPTIAERWGAAGADGSPGFALSPASTARIQGLQNLRWYTAWKTSGPGGQPGDPRLYFCDTPGNRRLFEQCKSMRTDAKKHESPEILNADPRTGNGGDDGFTALRYLCASRPYHARESALEMGKGAWHPENLAAQAGERADGSVRQVQVLTRVRQTGVGYIGDGLV